MLRITVGGAISVLASGAQITAVTGNDTSRAEGGVAVNQFGQVFFGDNGDIDGDRNPNILMSLPSGLNLSLFVTTAELNDFYAPDFVPDLSASMAIEGVDGCAITQIPTLSEWGLIAMAGVLGLIGFIAIRRRKATA